MIDPAKVQQRIKKLFDNEVIIGAYIKSKKNIVFITRSWGGGMKMRHQKNWKPH